jgi:hypothetical protein
MAEPHDVPMNAVLTEEGMAWQKPAPERPAGQPE